MNQHTERLMDIIDNLTSADYQGELSDEQLFIIEAVLEGRISKQKIQDIMQDLKRSEELCQIMNDRCGTTKEGE